MLVYFNNDELGSRKTLQLGIGKILELGRKKFVHS